VSSETEFWEKYIEVVRPDGTASFGRNLNAFWDAVSGGGPGWPGKCDIHFVNTDGLRSIDDGRFYSALREIASNSRYVLLHFD
jgi:ribonuclease inhibitor